MTADQLIPILCPKCRQESKQRLGRLKKELLFDCPTCGADLTSIRNQIVEATERAEEDVADDYNKIMRGDDPSNKGD